MKSTASTTNSLTKKNAVTAQQLADGQVKLAKDQAELTEREFKVKLSEKDVQLKLAQGQTLNMEVKNDNLEQIIDQKNKQTELTHVMLKEVTGYQSNQNIQHKSNVEAVKSMVATNN